MPTLPATTVDFFLAGLESFMRRSGQGTHWGVTMLRLEGRPDAAMLTRAWEEVHAQHPLLGARLKRAWRGWRLVWETRGPISAPEIVWHPLESEPPDEAIIRERFQGRTQAGALAAPLLLEVFPCDGGTQHVVLLTWRHALLDGTGVNLLLGKLAAGACAAGPPTVVAQRREGISRVFKRAQPLMKRLYQMTCAGCLSVWRKGMAVGGAPAFRLIELSAVQSQAATVRLRETCGDFLQMPFYAAIAARALCALHELRGWQSPVIHLQLPIQSRGRSPDLLFGNHMGTLPLFLDTPALGTLESAITHLQECYRTAMREHVTESSEALMVLASHLPVRWFIPTVRLQNLGQICSLFHSHTGTFLAGRTDFAGAKIQNVCTIPSVCSPPGLGIFFSDYAGRITVTLSWREGCITKDEMTALCHRVQADMTGDGKE